MAKELNAKIESKIMDYLKKRSEQSSITEISRDLDIGRNTVAKYLELLKFQGLVEQRSIGQAKLWSLTHTPFNFEKYGVSIRDMKVDMFIHMALKHFQSSVLAKKHFKENDI